MIFSGSVSSSLSFSLAGSPTLGSETKAVDLSFSQSIDQGTAAGQATAGWADVISIPAGSVLAIDLGSVDATALGFNGTVAFTQVRAISIRNRAAAATAVLLVGCPSSGNDTNAYAAKLQGGGRWGWEDFTHGAPVTAANQTLTITNTSAAAISVEIGIIGLGTYVDAGA
jgi:hypothetical protein